MLGSETLYKVRYEGEKEEANTFMVKSVEDTFGEDEHVWLNVALENLYFFDKGEMRIRENDNAEDYAACVECLKGE